MNSRLVATCISVLIVGCSTGGLPPSFDTVIVQNGWGEDPIVRTSTSVVAPCRSPAEWDLVGWPQLDVIPATSMATTPFDTGTCETTLDAESPLVERWYAVRWRGEIVPPEVGPRGLPLLDGSQVWPFLGLVPAEAMRIRASEGAVNSVRVEFANEIEPAPGYEASSMMLVTQGGSDPDCTYTLTIGWLDARCETLDLALPVTIHTEGAIAHYGARGPVPVLDVTHTFMIGPDGFDVHQLIPQPPVAPRVPAELCAGEYCE